MDGAAQEWARRGPRVVVGVDGSPASRAALGWAMTATAPRGASLEVIAAYPVELYGRTPTWPTLVGWTRSGPIPLPVPARWSRKPAVRLQSLGYRG
ncbi:MAG: hypothetical protein JWO98_1175 [Frankiales bacterium]|nr:hypothetical protein [Frankiales bacterium]